MPRGLSALTYSLVLALAACRGESRSKDAKPETLQTLRDDEAAVRHPSDGGGTADLAPGSPREIRVGELARFEIIYEAGPLGVDPGGVVFLSPSPFWGWDSPQTRVEGAPGFVSADTDAAGVSLRPEAVGGLFAIRVEGRKLAAGERIHIRYASRADRFAEHEERIFIAVDGDGDGVRALVERSPRVDVLAGPPARLLVTLPTTARPGQTIRAVVAAVDASGNAGVSFEGEVRLEGAEGLRLPASVRFAHEDRGRRALEGVVREAGVYRVRARDPSGLSTESNPLVVREEIPRILWGDFHGHSQLSDGTGTPEDYYAYARDVAALDVVALTDHDHWGMRMLDRSPELWNRIEATASSIDEPGRFVALVGYEWTNWLQGHRHVLFFDDEPAILSSFDPRYETPPLLWRALDGRSALTIAHHSAGGPVSTDWDFLPPAAIEPVAEIVSVHGSSEAWDSAGRIYSAVPGNFVRDALDLGAVFGFIGSGDSHDGHPGLAHLASPSGGLTAIFAEEATREAILEALRSRRVYATNGVRIWLRMWLDGEPMGSLLSPTGAESQELRFAVAGTSPLASVEIIRSGRIALAAPVDGDVRELSRALEVPSLSSGEYLYLRVAQEDGGMAWTSPIYVR